MSSLDEIAEKFGPDLVADVRTIIRNETADLQRQVADGNLQIRRNRVMAEMDRDPILGAVWRQVNNEPAFIEWLHRPDPLFGMPRMEPLQRAFNAGDAALVRVIFARFLAEQGRIPPQAAASSVASRPATRRAPASGQRQWTRAIARFYEDCRTGKYLNNSDERRRIEADIIAAGKEGRITDLPMVLDSDKAMGIAAAVPRPRFRHRPTA